MKGMSEEEVKQYIGKKINTGREYRGKMPQRELSEKTGIIQTFLSRIENGKGSISAHDLAAIAEALVLPISFFFPNATPSDFTDEEIAHIALLRQLPEEARNLIYKQAQDAWTILQQIAAMPQVTLGEEQNRMMYSGRIPPEQEFLYEFPAMTLAGIMGADKQEILTILKTGGVYETEYWTLTVAPPEKRTEEKQFYELRQRG